MPGGNFTVGQEKVRPGTYVNFVSAGSTTATLTERGVVLIPLLNWDWAPAKTFIEITSGNLSTLKATLGHDITDAIMFPIREALKRSLVVMAYRPTDGVKATAVIGNLTATAKYSGTLGNSLKVVVANNVISGMDVTVYLGTTVIFNQEGVADVQSLNTSDWVVFTGTGALTTTAGTNLAGGTNGTQSNADITAFLDDSETQDFNTMAFPLTDSALIAAFDSKMKYFIEQIGKQVQGVRPKAGIAPDHDGIITLRNGSKLEDGTLVNATNAVYWVAAAEAGARVNQSLTHVAYDGSADAYPRLTNEETIEAIKNGEFVFTAKNGTAIIEDDINSFTSFTDDKNESFSSNRTIRTLQEIQKLTQIVWEPNKYNDNEDGFAIAEKDFLQFILEPLQAIEALKNVEETDVVIDMAKSTGKNLYADVAVQVVESKTKFYVTVTNGK